MGSGSPPMLSGFIQSVKDFKFITAFCAHRFEQL